MGLFPKVRINVHATHATRQHRQRMVVHVSHLRVAKMTIVAKSFRLRDLVPSSLRELIVQNCLVLERLRALVERSLLHVPILVIFGRVGPHRLVALDHRRCLHSLLLMGLLLSFYLLDKEGLKLHHIVEGELGSDTASHSHQSNC